MKSVKNESKVWICPKHKVCDGRWRYGSPCGHNRDHERNTICSSVECGNYKEAACHFE